VTTVPPQAPPAARLPIDPRIRERLIAVRRAEGRRRLRFICVTLAAVLLGGTAIGITHSTWLAVHHVEVTGDAHTGRGQVLATAGLRPGLLMVDVHPAQMARRLANLPWVDTASVSRHWPDSVQIRIRERQAAAQVATGPARAALIDLSGRVLAIEPAAPAAASASSAASASLSTSPASASPASASPAASSPAAASPAARSVPGGAAPLPTIRGLDPAGPPGTTFAGDPAALGALALVAAVDRGLAPATAARVVAVQVMADGQLSAAVTPSVTVRFGLPDGLDAKVLALGTLMNRADLKGVSTIDVRVPDDPVLTRPGGASTVSTTPRG
jgi:POTRA domain, FtsQ-type